jgi:hypothetical protein
VVRDVVAQVADVVGPRFSLPRMPPRTLFLSGRIEGTLSSEGTTSLVIWDYHHHVVEYLAVVFLAGSVLLGLFVGVIALLTAAIEGLVVLVYMIFNGLMLAVVLQLMKDERSKLRADLENTLARVGHWTLVARTRIVDT